MVVAGGALAVVGQPVEGGATPGHTTTITLEALPPEKVGVLWGQVLLARGNAGQEHGEGGRHLARGGLGVRGAGGQEGD